MEGAMYPLGICRLCEELLTTSRGYDCLDMPDLQKNIQSLLGVEITKEDKCSTHLCGDCLSKVVDLSMFKKRAIIAQENVNEYFRLTIQAIHASQTVDENPIKIMCKKSRRHAEKPDQPMSESDSDFNDIETKTSPPINLKRCSVRLSRNEAEAKRKRGDSTFGIEPSPNLTIEAPKNSAQLQTSPPGNTLQQPAETSPNRVEVPPENIDMTSVPDEIPTADASYSDTDLLTPKKVSESSASQDVKPVRRWTRRPPSTNPKRADSNPPNKAKENRSISIVFKKGKHLSVHQIKAEECPNISEEYEHMNIELIDADSQYLESWSAKLQIMFSGLGIETSPSGSKELLSVSPSSKLSATPVKAQQGADEKATISELDLPISDVTSTTDSSKSVTANPGSSNQPISSNSTSTPSTPNQPELVLSSATVEMGANSTSSTSIPGNSSSETEQSLDPNEPLLMVDEVKNRQNEIENKKPKITGRIRRFKYTARREVATPKSSHDYDSSSHPTNIGKCNGVQGVPSSQVVNLNCGDQAAKSTETILHQNAISPRKQSESHAAPMARATSTSHKKPDLKRTIPGTSVKPNVFKRIQVTPINYRSYSLNPVLMNANPKANSGQPSLNASAPPIPMVYAAIAKQSAAFPSETKAMPSQRRNSIATTTGPSFKVLSPNELNSRFHFTQTPPVSIPNPTNELNQNGRISLPNMNRMTGSNGSRQQAPTHTNYTFYKMKPSSVEPPHIPTTSIPDCVGSVTPSINLKQPAVQNKTAMEANHTSRIAVSMPKSHRHVLSQGVVNQNVPIPSTCKRAHSGSQRHSNPIHSEVKKRVNPLIPERADIVIPSNTIKKYPAAQNKVTLAAKSSSTIAGSISKSHVLPQPLFNQNVPITSTHVSVSQRNTIAATQQQVLQSQKGPHSPTVSMPSSESPPIVGATTIHLASPVSTPPTILSTLLNASNSTPTANGDQKHSIIRLCLRPSTSIGSNSLSIVLLDESGEVDYHRLDKKALDKIRVQINQQKSLMLLFDTFAKQPPDARAIEFLGQLLKPVWLNQLQIVISTKCGQPKATNP